MNEEGQIIKGTAVRFERLLPGPIERVWEHLTSSDHLPEWFGGVGMKYVIEPRVGGSVSLANDHIRGVVTQWEPPRLLVYTWNVFSPGETESRFPESYVTFQLQPQGNDVLLTLTHLPVLEGFERQTMMGWHTFLDLLFDLLRGRKPEPRDVVMERNRERYGITELKR
jgi:uncharacterized protein YndB with AHSA1/START domain